MEQRKPSAKDYPKSHSPSPEAPSEDSRLQSLLRCSRATSEPRSEVDEPATLMGSRYSSAARASVARDDGDEELYGSPHTPPRPPAGAHRGGTGSHTPSPAKRVAGVRPELVPGTAAYSSARSSRAGSEVPDREGPAADSQRGSRAGSEAPQRFHDPVSIAQPEDARASRAGSAASVDGVASVAGQSGAASSPQPPAGVPSSGQPPPPPTTKKHRSTKVAKSSTLGGPSAAAAAPAASVTAHRTPATAQEVLRYYGSPTMPAEHIQDVERYIYHTVRRSTGVFEYYQLLHYPLKAASSPSASTAPAEEDLASEPRAGGAPCIDTSISGEGGLGAARASAGSTGSGASGGGKDPSPPPRGPSGSSGGSSSTAAPQVPPLGKEDSDSPSPHFDESAFNATFDAPDFLNQAGGNLQESFSIPLHTEEATQQSVSVLAMAMLPDPVSGAPVLGICLGDYSGHVEYFEVSPSESNNRKIRKSKSLARTGRRSASSLNKTKRSVGVVSATESVDSQATVNIMNDMRGREVARRHSHKAYVKSINALTSVAVEPCVKCLTFVRPHSSPSMISYLTANDRVIKLFHVRREGFSPFSAFPYMEEAVGRTFMGSRYFARLPAQTSILPIKEYGPSANSIQALSVSADNETFLSVEDLQVFWWSFEASDTTRATCIADLRPPSGALDEVEELVTAAAFHPTHSSLFMLSRSSGVLNIGDLRDPPSREQRQYAITTQVIPQQNPTMCPAYDEILCSISAAAFLSPDHVVTRDYLSLKLWDLRKPDTPYAMTPVMNYVARYLDPLYENDSIFDRFPIAVDDVSGTVVTGLYDGAVAVWQPLSSPLPQDDVLVHYRADPFVEPVAAAAGGRVGIAELEESLEAAWQQHSSSLEATGGAGAGGVMSGTGDDGSAASVGGLGGLQMPGPEGCMEEIPEPFTNKVLNVAIAPGGERFGYTYKNGRLVYVFERKGRVKHPVPPT